MGEVRRGQLKWDPSILLRCLVLAGLVVSLLASHVQAAEGSPTDAALSDRALPGVARLQLPRYGERALTFGGGVAYGFTEDQDTAPGSHHRLQGQLALAIAPLPWLSIAGRSQLRYDRHDADAQGSDDGAVLESDLYAGTAFQVSPHATLGIGVGAAFSRGDTVGSSLSNPALEASVQAGLQVIPGRFQLGANVGYRHDRRSGGLSDVNQFRPGDRLALGLSDYDAALAVVGGSYRLLGDTHLLAELSADVLLGEGAPAISQSPLRVTLGASQVLSGDMWLRVLADASLSQRPELATELTPVEPRVSLLVGLQYRMGGAEEVVVVDPGPPPPLEPEEESKPEEVALATTGLVVNVTDPDGFPLSDAAVQITSGATERQVPHSERAAYQLDDVAVGTYQLEVSAARLKPHTQSIVLQEGEPLQIDVRLEAAPPSGQIRGLVRSFGGRTLAARVRIEPLGTELSANADGSFDVDVPPGRYVVVIQAPGHRTQKRSVTVKRDGVVVLNADLREGSP